MTRRKTRQISVGSIKIGSNSPISVQSMTNTDTVDVKSTVNQIKALEKAGCEIVRVAVPNMEAAEAVGKIKKSINIPLIADIHFDYRLALKVIDKGIDGLRLNPGNIGDKERVKTVVKAAQEKKIPIRIGVNAGSLEKDILEKHKHPTPEAMVESALRHIRILEDLDFHEIKISLKASDVWKTIQAYRLLAKKVDYPFHIGITEAGTIFSGTIKSAAGLGILLSEGIGDTLRVSLTGDPVEEVRVGWEILKAMKLRERGVNIISCPTCGRIKLDIITLANEIEKRLSHITKPINIAVMGCVVNGPGEAVESDIGIAGGDGVGLLYIKGKPAKKVKEEDIVEAIVREVEKGRV
ncbi:MAG: 4-hydroxy-3-methylbut-2-en-1-yl diphosphate synthase [Deltaproteobacteria bacterium RIFCSPLOWO2_12_FULL_43_16]|nr:MAG: 4-hydroxy-3-methylbut-2-en-1-yl diphosphate synthase [Deltaproteobacteria bacterium GWA2_43_19]OGQ58519.1 MAG: 4-hydroxy-3-methylbut-2-en-1-yl diphosphate synthase [Deltaproteobacteria bacterium RIFCSPLOWO2_12_FULL_43_16]